MMHENTTLCEHSGTGGVQLRTRRDGARRVGMIDIAMLYLRRTTFAGGTLYDLVMLVLSFLSLLYLLMRLLLRFVRVFLGLLGAYVTNGFGEPCSLRVGPGVGRAAIAHAQRFFFCTRPRFLAARTLCSRGTGEWSVVRGARGARSTAGPFFDERCALAGRPPFWCQSCPL